MSILRCLVGVFIFAVMLSHLGAEAVKAAELGFAGLNDYSSGPSNCVHGDRAGRSFCQNVDAQLSGTTVFSRYDTGVYDSELRSTSVGPNFANFFSYSGHGHRYDYGQIGGASLHPYSRSSSQRYHGSAEESYGDVNTAWDELRLGHHGTTEELRWFSAYTCNFLTNGGLQSNKDRQGYMFEGLHLALGFAGVMYLDSRAGTDYGAYLNSGYTIKNAWHTINMTWQENHSLVTSRVFGHWHTQADSFPAYNTESLTWYVHFSPQQRAEVYLYYDLPVGG